MLISLLNVSNLFQNGHFQPILAAIFVTIATIQVKLTPGLYAWAFAIKPIRKIWLKAFFIVWPYRGPE